MYIDPFKAYQSSLLYCLLYAFFIFSRKILWPPLGKVDPPKSKLSDLPPRYIYLKFLTHPLCWRGGEGLWVHVMRLEHERCKSLLFVRHNLIIFRKVHSTLKLHECFRTLLLFVAIYRAISFSSNCSKNIVIQLLYSRYYGFVKLAINLTD